MSFIKIYIYVSIFPSLFAGICLRMPFVVFLQGYSPDYLNYVSCTFLFIFSLNKIHCLIKSSYSFGGVEIIVRNHETVMDKGTRTDIKVHVSTLLFT